MEEIKQAFSEDNFKQSKNLTASQTFKVTGIKRFPITLAAFIFIPLCGMFFMAQFIYPKHQAWFMLAGLICTLLYIFILYALFNVFTEEQDLELFSDRLILKRKEETVVYFSDVHDYKVNNRSTLLFLDITLKNGKTEIIGAKSNNGLEEFVAEFVEKCPKKFNKENLFITRYRPYLQSKLFLAFLSTITFIQGFLFIAIIIKFHHLPPLGVWPGYIICGALWFAYLKFKN